jgi:preprotein translocase subunit SecG
MTLFLTVVHVMVCVFLIIVVLLQRGKGAEIGAVFGGGAGNTLFGSRGAGNFLTKLTTGAAFVFMLTSLSLAYFAQEGTRSTLFEEEAPAASEEPAPFAEPAPPAEEPGGGFEEVAPPAQDQPTAEGAEAPAPPADAGGEREAPAAPVR